MKKKQNFNEQNRKTQIYNEHKRMRGILNEGMIYSTQNLKVEEVIPSFHHLQDLLQQRIQVGQTFFHGEG